MKPRRNGYWKIQIPPICPKKNDRPDSRNSAAALIQLKGEVREGDAACQPCKQGRGVFKQCIANPPLAQGVCGNCHYNGQSWRCTFKPPVAENQTSANSRGRRRAVPSRRPQSPTSPGPASNKRKSKLHDDGSRATQNEVLIVQLGPRENEGPRPRSTHRLGR